MKTLRPLALAASFFACTAWSQQPPQMKGENLLQTLPDGFAVAYQASQGPAFLTEMIPQGETVEQWTQMITTQVYLGQKDMSFEAYQANMKNRFDSACEKSDLKALANGNKNGYDFNLWMQSCLYKVKDAPPEITMFKMFKGNDSTYVVQYAFRSFPSKEQLEKALQYLQSLTVCDSRIKGRECPKVVN